MFSLTRPRAKRTPGRVVLEMLEDRRLMSVSFEPAAGQSLIPSTDIHISTLSGDQTEPAIAIDPSNPARMFSSANHGLHGAGLFAAYSSDAGATWNKTDASDGVIAQGGSGDLPLACCNSSVAFDRFGNLFLTYLEANTGKVALAVSTDGGQSFGTNVTRFGGTNNDTDQPTVITGPGSNGSAESVWVLYINHNVNPTTHVDTENMAVHGAAVNGAGRANIGAFSDVQLMPDVSGVAQNFGDASVGANGELLVAFQDDTSADGPVNIYASLDGDGLGSGGFSTPVLVTSTNVGGEDAIPAQPDLKIDSGIGLAYDLSGGPHQGRVYMVYTDENINESDDMDTRMTYSDEDGLTWSESVRVNDDATTRSQFLPRIAVDPQSGLVGVSWYDARNDSGSGSADTDGVANTNAQIYAAISDDGGASFSPNVLVSDGVSFHRTGWSLDYGGYSGLAFFAGTLYPAWADNSLSVQNFEVYTDRVVVAGSLNVNHGGEGDAVIMSEIAGHFLKIEDGAKVQYATAASSMVDVAGGSLMIDSSLHLAGLSIDAGTVTMNTGGGGVLVVDALAMAKVAGSYVGRLDLKDNDLILNAPTGAAAESALAEMEDMVARGRNEGGYWIGNGITSGVAAVSVDRNTGLGLIRNSDDGITALVNSFDGEAVNANSVLLKYTWNGDADVDGDVDPDDFARIDAGSAGGLSGYRNGDFDYRGGSPDADDFFLIDKAFAGQGAVLVAAGQNVIALALNAPLEQDRIVRRVGPRQIRKRGIVKVTIEMLAPAQLVKSSSAAGFSLLTVKKGKRLIVGTLLA